MEIKKTQLFREKIKLLGCYFEKDAKKVTERKAVKLAECRVETAKEIVGSLAFINFLREFFDPRVLTRCGKVLRGYVRKGGKPIGEFKTDVKAQGCAQELREGLKGYKLRTYGGGGSLIVLTDASDCGVGGVSFEV